MSILGNPSIPLKTVDPVRYGSLVHPGDSFSYDIFSQAGEAIRQPSGPNPLADLRLKTVIATGESQSAFRMVTYIDAIHPVARVYDGFLVHSRASTGVPLSEAPQPVIPVPSPTVIRSDLDVPVLTFQTETDLLFLQSLAARQDDTDRLRLWEVAGTAHADTYLIVTGMSDLGKSPDAANLVLTSSPLGVFICPRPINSGPQHFVLNAAIHWLTRWVRRGTLPPSAPRLDVDPGPPAQFVLDGHGNVTGGIRTPELDVPSATSANHGQYVHCVAGVAKAAVASGSLPQECKSAVVRCAANSTCGKPGFVACCVTRNSVTRCHRTRRLCDAAKGGHIGACPSCCDACTGGCPTTTTSTLPCVFQAGFGCIPSGCDPGFECLALQPFSCQCVPVGSTSTSPPPAAAPAAR